MSPAELKLAIWQQNRHLHGELQEEAFNTGLVDCHTYTRKQSESTNWIIEVTANVRNVIRKSPTLYIGWKRCRILDYVRASRCVKCLELGHVAKYCRSNNTSCTHCYDQYIKEDCPNDAEDPRCAPCRRRNKPSDHSFNDNNCPIYKRVLEKVLEETDYGT